MATRRGGRRGGSSLRRSVSSRMPRRSSRSSSKSRSSRSPGMGTSRGGGYSLTGVYRKAKKTLIGS